MGTRMGGEEAKGQPTAVDVFGRCRDEASHVVTPEREATQAETQSTPQVTHHADVVGSSVAAPVQRIAL